MPRLCRLWSQCDGSGGGEMGGCPSVELSPAFWSTVLSTAGQGGKEEGSSFCFLRDVGLES